ncbi:putative dihydrolipoamide succinyltransferase [Syncephalis pseudoplumigaleata]|uniref:Dihydrolipoamide acetyltransferase component of pyruvate dehydrogenase complex n=1 Tax=Syncephalis pseudoplumigaleata TaxID=1712513 RepID=A0A4P9Z1M8_9FUNG|nr:putative dihydrolipoamide succinyltransferase [Syncephalis pseudoplumigaleata]|eukprot:RKP25651.1 putative dihydrolipoamide succinyltransferase [Syncephalis pseudoplumigaleata]
MAIADMTVKVPGMGDSITEGTLKQWNKQVGDYVEQDEEVASIETDKIDVPVNAPNAGKITKLFYNEEDTVAVGADLFSIDASAEKPAAPRPEPAAPAPSTPPPPSRSPAPATATAPPPAAAAAAPSPPPTTAAAPESTANKIRFGQREERRVKMNRMRMRIAERLKESQNTAASLTTFNEIDMTNLMNLRTTYKDAVLKKHGVKLGFMSAFVRASCIALAEIPMVNASIEGGGDTIVYRDYADISVAVATPKGLVTPVLRNAESMSFIEVERAIVELGVKVEASDIYMFICIYVTLDVCPIWAREKKLTLEDMTGGSFTVSNGGVFGSLMGTPIINMPQSAILGMHAIKERPVAVNGQVEIRPMMYVALTYDHRIIDGREAVTFLIKVKEAIEDPRRLLLDV